ncbi:MAG: hypothetical protein ACLPYZ_05575 [Limisphaerales bacterium]
MTKTKKINCFTHISYGTVLFWKEKKENSFGFAKELNRLNGTHCLSNGGRKVVSGRGRKHNTRFRFIVTNFILVVLLIVISPRPASAVNSQRLRSLLRRMADER